MHSGMQPNKSLQPKPNPLARLWSPPLRFGSAYLQRWAPISGQLVLNQFEVTLAA